VKIFGFVLLTALIVASVAACASQAPPPAQPVIVSQTLLQSTPPPPISTPVPVVHARPVPGAGRPDPFVALYGPATESSSSSKPPKSVSVSTFPNIPTLPGFQTGPGGVVRSIWDGVGLTGIVRDAGYTAIVEADGKSYIVRQGDSVAGKFRVATIGPDFVTLETLGSPRLARTFSLGG
jgi:hypothetical protein